MAARSSVRYLAAPIPLLFAGSQASSPNAPLEFGISFDESLSAEPLDGRILLEITSTEEREPRFQVNAGLNAPQVFGIDIEGLRPGAEAGATTRCTWRRSSDGLRRRHRQAPT